MWTSADTIVPKPADPQSLNRYSYVGNSPLVGTDPSGHCKDPNSSDDANACWEAFGWILDAWGDLLEFLDYDAAAGRWIGDAWTANEMSALYNALRGTSAALGSIGVDASDVFWGIRFDKQSGTGKAASMITDPYGGRTITLVAEKLAYQRQSDIAWEFVHEFGHTISLSNNSHAPGQEPSMKYWIKDLWEAYAPYATTRECHSGLAINTYNQLDPAEQKTGGMFPPLNQRPSEQFSESFAYWVRSVTGSSMTSGYERDGSISDNPTLTNAHLTVMADTLRSYYQWR